MDIENKNFNGIKNNLLNLGIENKKADDLTQRLLDIYYEISLNSNIEWNQIIINNLKYLGVKNEERDTNK